MSKLFIPNLVDAKCPDAISPDPNIALKALALREIEVLKMIIAVLCQQDEKTFGRFQSVLNEIAQAVPRFSHYGSDYDAALEMLENIRKYVVDAAAE